MTNLVLLPVIGLYLFGAFAGPRQMRWFWLMLAGVAALWPAATWVLLGSGWFGDLGALRVVEPCPGCPE